MVGEGTARGEDKRSGLLIWHFLLADLRGEASLLDRTDSFHCRRLSCRPSSSQWPNHLLLRQQSPRSVETTSGNSASVRDLPDILHSDTFRFLPITPPSRDPTRHPRSR